MGIVFAHGHDSLKTLHFGHDHIRDHDIEISALQLNQCFLAVARGDDGLIVRAEKGGLNFGELFIIVD